MKQEFSEKSTHHIDLKIASMSRIELEIPEIPHGHGLSFKKGLADGLLGCRAHDEDPQTKPHKTHSASYERGILVGQQLKQDIAKLVKA